jgi:hypothetical protein
MYYDLGMAGDIMAGEEKSRASFAQLAANICKTICNYEENPMVFCFA